MHTHTYIHAHIHTHTYSHAYKYMHACMHTHTHSQTCTHTYPQPYRLSKFKVNRLQVPGPIFSETTASLLKRTTRIYFCLNDDFNCKNHQTAVQERVNLWWIARLQWLPSDKCTLVWVRPEPQTENIGSRPENWNVVHVDRLLDWSNTGINHQVIAKTGSS